MIISFGKAVALIIVLSQATAIANAAEGEGLGSPCSASSGAMLATLPTSVVDRTSLNPAAKAEVSQLTLCLIKGEQIFIMPTVVVHYFIRQKGGTIRSKTVMLSQPRASVQEANDLALTFQNGEVRHFPRTALISSQTADDYEIYMLRPGLTKPSYLYPYEADYVVK